MSRHDPPRPPDERHTELRTALGAYAVGALDPAERATVEAHLAGCAECRDELSQLAALPGLLSRVPLDRVEGDQPALRPEHLERLVAAVGSEQRTRRHRLRAWQLGAAAAAAVAIALAIVLIPAPEAGERYAGRAVSAEAVAQATAWVEERAWGMTVALEVTSLPERQGYVLWAVAEDGHRAQVASWTRVEASPVRVEGSCYLMAGDVDRLEITDPDDEVLIALAPA